MRKTHVVKWRSARQTLQFAVFVAAIVFVTGATLGASERFAIVTGKSLSNLMDEGTVNCIGGELLTSPGSFPLLCTPGTKQTHVRGAVERQTYELEGDAAALVSGENTITFNCNFDETLKGHCWGTWLMTVADHGIWEGTFSGEFDFDLDHNFAGMNASYKIIGHGSGGDLEGLQLQADAVAPVGDGYWAYLVMRIIFTGAQ